MSEVYCKDCKFIHYNWFDSAILTCERKYGLVYKVKHPVYGEVEEENLVAKMHPTDRNRDLDCRYFEPKLMVRIWRMIG